MLQWSVVTAAILTALCPIYLAVFLMRLYEQHHQSVTAAWSVGVGWLLTAALYLIFSAVYVFARRLHPLLQVLAAMVACITVERAFGYWSLVQNRNMLTNIQAEPVWEMCGRIAIACLCLAHFVVERGEPKARPH
jgi:hypothetical protein